jgi:hypothetical protein
MRAAVVPWKKSGWYRNSGLVIIVRTIIKTIMTVIGVLRKKVNGMQSAA